MSALKPEASLIERCTQFPRRCQSIVEINIYAASRRNYGYPAYAVDGIEYAGDIHGDSFVYCSRQLQSFRFHTCP